MQYVLALIALVSIWAAARILYLQGNRIMSSVDDLNTALTGLQTAVTNAVNTIQSEAAAVLAAHNNDDTAAVEAAVANINTVAATLNTAVAAAASPAPPTA